MNISEIAEIISSSVAFVGLFSVAFQIRHGDNRNRRKATLDYSRETLDTRHKDRPGLPDDYDKEAVSEFVSECLREAKGNGEEHPNLDLAVEYLNVIEGLCTGVKAGIYDGDVACAKFWQLILAVRDGYAPLIMWWRENSPAKTLYCDLADMASQFENKRKYKKIQKSMIRLGSRQNKQLKELGRSAGEDS